MELFVARHLQARTGESKGLVQLSALPLGEIKKRSSPCQTITILFPLTSHKKLSLCQQVLNTMKAHISFLLAMVASVSVVKAGWDTPSPRFSWNALCGSHAHSSIKHICFDSLFDVRGITINTDFHGSYSSDNKSES